jgi:RNA polymerase sigma-70 factor (ECF subfamily)
MCFHSARLDAKVNTENELLDLKSQDRNKWSFPLIQLGNAMMNKAVENEEFSSYHYEAAIVAEHLKAPNFEQTNWDKILHWYLHLYKLKPAPIHLLTMAVVCLQSKNYIKANYYFEQLDPEDLEQRSYLYYGAKADYYASIKKKKEAIIYLDIALEKVNNNLEREFLKKKKLYLTTT